MRRVMLCPVKNGGCGKRLFTCSLREWDDGLLLHLDCYGCGYRMTLKLRAKEFGELDTGPIQLEGEEP